MPESYIDSSLPAKGAIAYAAIVDGEMVGEAIAAIDSTIILTLRTLMNQMNCLAMNTLKECSALKKI